MHAAVYGSEKAQMWFLFRTVLDPITGERIPERLPLPFPFAWSIEQVRAEIDRVRKQRNNIPLVWSGNDHKEEREPHNVPKPRSELEGSDIAHIESAEAEPSAETDLFEYHLSAVLAQS
jgi:hypothetical protein